MPLKINLKKDQKIILNGAVLKNSSAHAVTLTLLNDSRLLQDKDILSYEEANTPAARVYYSLQCAYLFEDERAEHLENFKVFSADYVKALPSSKEIVDDLAEKVNNGELFRALKQARDLIMHETKVLEHVQSTNSELSNDSE